MRVVLPAINITINPTKVLSVIVVRYKIKNFINWVFILVFFDLNVIFRLHEKVNISEVKTPPILEIMKALVKKRYKLNAERSISVAIKPKTQNKVNLFESLIIIYNIYLIF
jgi:hypothetical protein